MGNIYWNQWKLTGRGCLVENFDLVEFGKLIFIKNILDESNRVINIRVFECPMIYSEAIYLRPITRSKQKNKYGLNNEDPSKFSIHMFYKINFLEND